MRKRGLLALWLLFVGWLMCACVSQSVNPLVKNEATAVPGLAMNAHPAVAGEQNTLQVTATLYFRYLDEPMLASEQRKLSVPRDQSVELAVVRALVEGPSAGHSELRRLLPAGATVESVTSRDDLIFVTFDSGLLKDDIPADWAESEPWRSNAPIQRKLAIQSIAASLTELYPYTGVQILLHQANEVQTDFRLANNYFLTGEDGLSEPVARDESLLLSPHGTALSILNAWQDHDFERLYRYIADEGKPPYATAMDAFSAFGTLTEFQASAGTVNSNGQRAVITVRYSTLTDGKTATTAAYPLHLLLENGIWKIPYEGLLALMNQ